MTRVFFVRHAQPNHENHDDFLRELTPKGMADRKLVTAFLLDRNVDVVLSSPYLRAVDTVSEYAQMRGLEIRTIDDFRERKIDSVWIPDFDGFSRQQWADFSYKLRNGECLQEVQDRYVAALNQVLTDYPGRNIAIGSHGTALSSLIHFFDPTFGYAGFQRIKGKMPWVAEFIFDDDLRFREIIEYDLI